MSASVADEVASSAVLRRRGLRRCRFCDAVRPRTEFRGLSTTCHGCQEERDALATAELERRSEIRPKPKPPRVYTGVPVVPAAPVLAAIKAAAEVIRAEDGGLTDAERWRLGLMSPETIICARADVSDRRYWEWRQGQKTIHAASAERVFFALDLLWWEVYDERRWPAEHEAASRVFG